MQKLAIDAVHRMSQSPHYRVSDSYNLGLDALIPNHIRSQSPHYRVSDSYDTIDHYKAEIDRLSQSPHYRVSDSYLMNTESFDGHFRKCHNPLIIGSRIPTQEPPGDTAPDQEQVTIPSLSGLGFLQVGDIFTVTDVEVVTIPSLSGLGFLRGCIMNKSTGHILVTIPSLSGLGFLHKYSKPRVNYGNAMSQSPHYRVSDSYVRKCHEKGMQ